MGERFRGTSKVSAPTLSPGLWHRMPAYAKDGEIACFFGPARLFKTRCATFGLKKTAS